MNFTGNLGAVPVKSLVAVDDGLLPSGTEFTSLVIQKELNVTSGLIDGINVTVAMEQRIPLRGNATIKSNFILNDSVLTGWEQFFFLEFAFPIVILYFQTMCVISQTI